jgi:hypothetical protein
MLGCKLLKRLLGKHGLCGGVSILRCTKCNREKWSTRTVHYLYRFLVRNPFNWEENPTSVDSIQSTETNSPGLVAMKIL